MRLPIPRALIGALILTACVQYFIAEAIAAAAWSAPAYSYTTNYISDLGVPGCGATIGRSPVCSPLATVMNIGFVLSGVLAMAAALLLAPLLAGSAWRRCIVGLAIVHGIGSILVGVVHSAPGTVEGSPRLHLIGAYMAILGGNAAIATVGLAARRSGAPGWFSGYGLALGLFGLASGLVLVVSRMGTPGLFERGAVDTISAWEVATGLVLLVTLRRRTARDGFVGIRDLTRDTTSRL